MRDTTEVEHLGQRAGLQAQTHLPRWLAKPTSSWDWCWKQLLPVFSELPYLQSKVLPALPGKVCRTKTQVCR